MTTPIPTTVDRFIKAAARCALHDGHTHLPNALQNAQHALQGILADALTAASASALITAVLHAGHQELARITLAWLRRHAYAITPALRHERDKRSSGWNMFAERYQHGWHLDLPFAWHGDPCQEAADLWRIGAWNTTDAHPGVVVTAMLRKLSLHAPQETTPSSRSLGAMMASVLFHTPSWNEPWPSASLTATVFGDPNAHPVETVHSLLRLDHPTLWVDHPVIEHLATLLTPDDALRIYEKATNNARETCRLASFLFLARYHRPALLEGIRTHGFADLSIDRLSAHAAIALVASFPTVDTIRNACSDPTGHTHRSLTATIANALDDHLNYRAILAAQAQALRDIETKKEAAWLVFEKAHQHMYERLHAHDTREHEQDDDDTTLPSALLFYQDDNHAL